MGYESDDLRPRKKMRRPSSEIKDLPSKDVVGFVVGDPVTPKPRQSEGEEVIDKSPGDYITDDIRPSKIINEHTPEHVSISLKLDAGACEKEKEENKMNMQDVKQAIESQSTRSGDDDIRRVPPKERKPSEEQGKITPSPKKDIPSPVSDTRPDTNLIKVICKYSAYIAIAIVVLWLLDISGTSLYRISVASSSKIKLALAMVGLAEVTIILYLMWRACRVFLPLKPSDQVRESSYSDSAKLRSKLLPYVKGFGNPSEYARSNFDADNAEEIDRLLNRIQSHVYADSTGFMHEYRQLQQKLDEKADEIIKKYALIVAVKTAASPWRILDMLAVFMNSTLMVCEISAIYNRRVPSQEAFKLVIRWMMNIYVAGEAGNLVENAIQSATEAIGNTCLKAAAPILGKVAEGGVNAALLYRLGYSAKNKFAALVD